MLDYRFLENVRRKYDVEAAVYNEDRLQAVSFRDSALIRDPNLDAVRRGAGRQEPNAKHDIMLAGSRYFVTGRQIQSDVGEPIGTLIFAFSTRDMYELLSVLIVTYGTIAMVLLALTIAITFRVTGTVAEPIGKLIRMTRRVAGGDLEARVTPMSQDEVGQLAVALNQMTEDLQGTTTSIEILNREIAERKAAEESLRHLRNYLKNVIDSMPSVLVGIDTDGKVTQWNRNAENAVGLPAHEAEGQLLIDVFPRLAGEMEKVRQAIADGQTRRDEKVAFRDGGETRFSDVTIYPLIANGVEGAVIRLDDITERVRLEEMMIQSEKMLSVGGLAAGMAHEINNPLAGILQNIQVVLDRTLGDLPANEEAARQCGASLDAIRAYLRRRDVPEMLDTVRDSGKQAAKIVKNMLSFSRKSGSGFEPRDLGDLLDRTIELASNDYDLRKKYDFRKIEIVKQYDPNLPQVSCEPTQIQQVVLNLLQNGAHAMAERAEPTEKLRFVLRTVLERDMARIEVEDNGPGISEEHRHRVFEPFYTTKEAGVGTGLGLSVSYFIVTENHGGTMAVESTPGVGTKFIVRLPLERVAKC